jgi:hypothetical protein
METTRILADHSYRELLNLLDWFYHHGPIPTIIGGWAVFFYNSYLGSVDIDLVGPSMGGLFDNTIESFERNQGYEAVTTDPLGLQTSFRKPVVEKNNLIGHVQIDACTYELDTGGFHENPAKKLPYSLCADPQLRTHLKFDERKEAYVPRKPLLLLYKLKALRDRQYELKTKGPILSPRTRNWLQSKWIKDGADLMALMDPQPRSYTINEELNTDLLLRIVESQSLQFALESLANLPDITQSLTLYQNAKREEVIEWVEKILKKPLKSDSNK